MGALGMAAAKVIPAAAATGGPTLLGNANSADMPTTVQTTATTATTTTSLRAFGAMAAGFSQAALDAKATFAGPLQGLGGPEGVDGWGSNYGVYGVSDTGTGVVGESGLISVWAKGSGRIRQERQATAGAPSINPIQFEQVRDLNGVLWLSGVFGNSSRSRWRRVNSLRFDTADGTGATFAPFRLVDTRTDATFVGPYPGGSTTSIVVPGAGPGGASAIPIEAIGIVGNLTAVGYTNVGYLTVFPTGIATPVTSSVNFLSGQSAVANFFAAGLGTGRAISIYVGSPAPGTTHFIVDITGYIQ
jgi:hypothetical protein